MDSYINKLSCTPRFAWLIMLILCISKLEGRYVSSPPTFDSDIDSYSSSVEHWPDGIIPYDFTDAMYDTQEKGVILAAMRRWEYKTCVKFVPWTESLKKELGKERFLKFFSAGSCFSRTGMQDDQPQLFGIGNGCIKIPTIIHELGHALGLVHQMERPDRDFYINIMSENMNEDSWKNFHKTDDKNMRYNLFGTPYDYKSIMHYGPKAWSKDKQTVLVTKDPAYQHVIGKADDVSFFDALHVNRAYRCSERCSSALLGICQNGGFLGGPDCRCICQDGYAGEFCETALPGFEHVIEWKCQKGWIFKGGKCYLINTDGTLGFHRARNACIRNNATLIMFKERPQIEWMNRLLEEQKSITETEIFWIGMKRSPSEDSSEVRWLDSSLVDNNLVSIVDSPATDSTSCAVFNGETISFSNCTIYQNRGYICEKDYDSTCGGRYFLSDHPIHIQSPGFPNGYPTPNKCTYILQTNEGSTMRIHFDTFELDGFNKDYLEVLLENDVTLPAERYNGESLGGISLQTHGNLAVLTFRANGRISGKGFEATVERIASKTATTPSSLPFLDDLIDAFKPTGETTTPSGDSQAWWSLSDLYNIMKEMAFAKLL